MSSRSRDVFVGSALSSVEVEFSAVCRPIIFPRADKSVVDDEENAHIQNLNQVFNPSCG